MNSKNILKKLRLVFAGCVAVLAIMGVALASDALLAEDAAAGYRDPICSEIRDAPGCGGVDNNNLDKSATNILNVLLWFGGGVAVMFIVVGAIQLVTSGGEPEKTKRGRQTLVFALIGLVVMIMAAIIVQTVYEYTN